MEFHSTPIDGVLEVRLAAREDDRGYFMRTFDRALFAARGLQTEWHQENQSLSNLRGTVRGLHFQRPPHAETKLVRALAGAVLDVAVNLRAGSPTYGHHYCVELSAANRKCLYIPKGFAHGFCTLTAGAMVAYKVDYPFTPNAEGGLLWSDARLGIRWPLEGDPANISQKDKTWPALAELQPLHMESTRS